MRLKPFALVVAIIVVLLPLSAVFAQAQVNTGSATNVTADSVTLQGTLVALQTAGVSMLVYFELGDTEDYGLVTDFEELSAPGAFSALVEGLEPNTTYHYRAAAGDTATGESEFGADATFTTGQGTETTTPPPTGTTTPPTTTPSGPTISTSAASNVAANTATLNGQIGKLPSAGAELQVFFEWGTSTSYGQATDKQPFGAIGPFTDSIKGLQPGTVYHFRAAVLDQNTSTFLRGSDATFTTTASSTTTAPAPGTVAVTTVAPSDLKADSATLKGELTSLGGTSPVQVYFEWGLTTSYGTTTAAQSKNATGAFTAALTGLSQGATYHYRSVAVSSSGAKVYGQDTTLVTAKSTSTTVGGMQLTSAAATELSGTSAVLNGSISGTVSGPVQVWFDWGTTTAYTNTTPPETLASAGPFKADISGLTPNTRYYFRAVAFVGGSAAKGADMNFTSVVTPATAAPSDSGGIPMVWIIVIAIFVILMILLLVLAMSRRPRYY